MGEYAKGVAGVCLVALIFIAPGLLADECNRADGQLLDDARRLTGYAGETLPRFESAGDAWPLSDMAFAYYQDGASLVVMNDLQTTKLPPVENCSVRLHEIVHHLQFLAGVTDLQAREVEAYRAQQQFLTENAAEYRRARHDGIFAVMHFKRMEQHLAQDFQPSDLLGAGLVCHGWAGHEEAQAVICVRH